MTCVPAAAFPKPRPVETAECGNVLRWIERNVREQPEDKAAVYVFPGQDSVTWTWRRLWNAALSYRHRLSAEGVRAGEVCALILRHDERFVPLYLGVALAARCPRCSPIRIRAFIRTSSSMVSPGWRARLVWT